jgi:putative ABC transport system permease protein
MISLVIALLVVYISIGYLRFENSYDTFHENSEQLYRVGRTQRTQDYATVGFGNWAETTAEKQKQQIQIIKDIAGIENTTHFIISNDTEFINYGDKELIEEGILTTNTPKSFTEMFSWELLSGSYQTFGDVENSVIINETIAKKLNTGSIDNLINSSLTIAGESYTIAAVIKDVPQNSHFDFKMATHRDQIPYWGSNVYVQLNEKSDPANVLKQFDKDILIANPGLATNPTYKNHFFQKITDIHLKSNILYELKAPGNTTYIYLISAFGLLIILISVFNYANFTIALKSKQSRVIGVRKVLGASNSSIALQFFIETVLLALLSLPFLLLTIFIVVPYFNTFMGVAITANPFINLEALGIVLSMSLIIGIIASIAPSIMLASQNTLGLLKEKLNDRKFEHFSLRKYVIISQFVILIGVSSISFFMYQQISFINNKDLGFQKEGVLYTFTSPDDLDVFQEKLKAIPGVRHVGNGSSFGLEPFNQLRYRLDGFETVFDDSNQFYLDYAAIQAYDLQTTLSPEIFDSSENRVNRNLINRSAAIRFAEMKGVTVEELIGTQIITEPEYQNEDGSYGFPITIDGIFKDINVFSLKESISSYFITVSDRVRMGGMSIVSFDKNATANTVSQIKELYATSNRSFPLTIEFLDEKYEQLHKNDEQTAQLIFILNGIAILLASLGIIGVTLLLIVGKTKEIGIRKVLGASIVQILKLSIKEYIYFVLIALVISTPIAWWIANVWLDNFAYRTPVQPLAFIVVGVLVFCLSAVIVSIVSYKSAVANPVNSLKTE